MICGRQSSTGCFPLLLFSISCSARCRTQLLSTRFIKQWTRHVTTQTTLHSQLPGFASQSLRVIRHVTSSSGARNLRKVEKELLEEDEGIARELDIPSVGRVYTVEYRVWLGCG